MDVIDPNTPTRMVSVIFDTTKAWEQWNLKVPADADEAWVRDHLDECEWVGMEECGNDSMDFVRMEEID